MTGTRTRSARRDQPGSLARPRLLHRQRAAGAAPPSTAGVVPGWSLARSRSEERKMIIEAGSATVCLAVLAAPWVRHHFAPQRLLVPMLLFTLCMFPEPVLGSSGASAGVAGTLPVLFTSSFAVIFAVVGTRASRTRAAWALLPWTLFVTACAFTTWPINSLSYAAWLAFATAVLAWIAGARVGGGGLVEKLEPEREILRWVGVFAVAQLAVCGLQVVGVPLFEMNASTAALMGSRTNGTLNHPNNLGKVAVLMAALILPAMRDADAQLRRRASHTFLILVTLVMLAQGRANFLALLLLVLAFTVLGADPGRVGRRFKLLGLLLVAALPLLPAIARRFEEDPAGGSRDRLTEVALQQLAFYTPQFGIGPNQYVVLVNPRFDEGDLPVHNSYLLFLVEQGRWGFGLFFGALALLGVWALRASIGKSSASRFGPALVALSIASVPIALTGWGMVSSTVLPLWLFVSGYLAGRIALTRQKPIGEEMTLHRSGGIKA